MPAYSITVFYAILEYNCNKCCNLIGHSEVSISQRDLQLSGWGQNSKVSVSLQQ